MFEEAYDGMFGTKMNCTAFRVCLHGHTNDFVTLCSTVKEHSWHILILLYSLNHTEFHINYCGAL